jgi:hypothetical protein
MLYPPNSIATDNRCQGGRAELAAVDDVAIDVPGAAWCRDSAQQSLRAAIVACSGRC